MTSRSSERPTIEIPVPAGPFEHAPSGRPSLVGDVHTLPFEGTGSFSFSEFLEVCKKDARQQVDCLNLVILRAQEALDYFNDALGIKDVSPTRRKLVRPATNLDVFQGKQLPCTVDRYVKRMLKYSNASSECNVVIAFLYLERIKRDYPSLHLTFYNIQRLLLTAVMIACKMFDDDFYANKHWGEIGEITNAEMNDLEFKFLALLNFNCQVQTEEYLEFVDRLRSGQQLLCSPQELLRPSASSSSFRFSAASSHCSSPPHSPVGSFSRVTSAESFSRMSSVASTTPSSGSSAHLPRGSWRTPQAGHAASFVSDRHRSAQSFDAAVSRSSLSGSSCEGSALIHNHPPGRSTFKSPSAGRAAPGAILEASAGENRLRIRRLMGKQKTESLDGRNERRQQQQQQQQQQHKSHQSQTFDTLRRTGSEGVAGEAMRGRRGYIRMPNVVRTGVSRVLGWRAGGV